MKKVFAAVLTALLLVGMFTACGSSKPQENGLNTIVSGKLIMSTNATFPPYEMFADDGSVIGIDVEIAQAIADKLGLELQVDNMEFDAALMAVQQSKADIVLAGVSVDETRLLVMDFSDSYTTASQMVIVKAGSDVTMDNLAEHVIGTQRGTTGYIYASDEFGESQVVAYDAGASAVQALMNGQVDCVIIDGAPAAEFVAANSGLTMLDGAWGGEEEYAIGMRKGNTELQNAVNTALEELTEDGTIPSIIAKYISAN